MDWINGKKSYIIAVAIVTYAILGFLLGYHDATKLAELILTALGLIGLRHGIAKMGQ